MNKREFLKILGVFITPPLFIQNNTYARCFNSTPEQIQGPFFKSGSPHRKKIFDSKIKNNLLTKITGYIFDKNCNPVPNVNLEFWHASPHGNYDNIGYEFRGQQQSDAFGRFFLETLRPGSYPGRTPHIHVKIGWKRKEIITQLYFSDESLNKNDYFYNPNLVLMQKYNKYHFNFFI